MLPFEQLTIGQYRGLRDLVLPGFGRLNIFVGANNSGKTSVLEALEIYCDPLDPLRWIAVADARDVRSNSVDRVDNLWWMFPRDSVAQRLDHGIIRLLATGATPHSGIEAHCDIRQITVDEHETTRLTRKFREFLTLLDAKDLSKDLGHAPDNDVSVMEIRRALDVIMTATPDLGTPSLSHFRLIEGERFVADLGDPAAPRTAVASVAPLSHRNRSIHADRLSQAKGSGLEGEAIALLQQFDPDVLDLDILARQGTFADLRIKHKRLGLAPLNAFGDGMRRALLYALTVPQVRGGVLLIDEIDSAIHVRALGQIFAWLARACAQFDVQVFASTHSLEALDALLGPADGDVSAIVGYHLPPQPASGEVTRYDGALLQRLVRDRGLDVR